MEEVRVIKVTGSEEMNDFIQLPKKIYRNIPQYVPEFESDVRGLFDIKTNPGLEFSKIQPFVAYRGEEPVGRIVGIVNRKANKRWNLKNVRFSMIEFIDDFTVSRALIEAVEAWGMEFGMEKIHGPLGVTDFDKEGMLVEDFDLTGSMTAIVVKRSKEEIRGEYGQRAFRLFNQAYESIFGFSELSPKQVDNFLGKYVALIDTRMIPIIENDKGEIVGAAVTMGSLCEATGYVVLVCLTPNGLGLGLNTALCAEYTDS